MTMPQAADPFLIVLALIALTMAPFMAMMLTSFTKLVIVFSLIRNALGIQQIPPNMVINGLAIILSIYVMAPVGYQMFDLLKDENFAQKDAKAIFTTLGKAKEPLRAFLLKHSDARERRFFTKSVKFLWPTGQQKDLRPDDFMVIVPAFTVSEITSAFEIGFLIYLPFIAIDLVISNILLAMGMMMVSPMTISLPFKLLLFVLVEGWAKIIHGLIITYQ